MNWHLFVLKVGYFITVVNSALVRDKDDVDEQGLYKSSDHVTILTINNFERKVYGHPYALLIQFYNSYCGHCRAFAPKYKSLAYEVDIWKNIVQLAVFDCSVEENNGICREFEVMAYPSLRYLHENYKKGNDNVGDRLLPADSAKNLKGALIKKMQSEQTDGRLSVSPPLNMKSYATIDAALDNIPSNVLFTFLIFENQNSTLGSELALDMNDYQQIAVKRVFNNSDLAKLLGVTNNEVFVVDSHLKFAKLPITPNINSESNFLKSINVFLKSKNYNFPVRDINFDVNMNQNIEDNTHISANKDTVYYSDLEKTIRTSLHTEITRYKSLSGQELNAVMDYLDILIIAFPFKQNNLKDYLTNLRQNLKSKNEWSGNEIYEMIKMLESTYAPVYSSNLDYVGCRGSQPKYRGYTCGLWTLFHTLTVNTYQKEDYIGPLVLKAMLNYIKYFFGCTGCSKHFQALAEKNKIFNVQENDKAILWLWIAHNEVNLRLAGDITEDPAFPKVQFPSTQKCPDCRLARGAWNLPAVFQYLLKMYGGKNIETARRTRSTIPASLQIPLSNLDIGMLSLLYILSFIMLIVVIKYFISNHFFRKRRLKHAWAKVQA